MRARSVILAGVVLAFWSTAADARLLKREMTPAETPSASYKGAQYIDSRGCVYIRSGYGGVVNWVPRITRSRKLICGEQPSVTAANRKQVAKSQPAQKTAAPRRATRPVRAFATNTTATPVAGPARKTRAFDWHAFWFGTARPARSTVAFAKPAQPPVAVPKPRTARVAPKPHTVRVAAVPVRARPTKGRFAIRTGPQAIHPSYYAQWRVQAREAAAARTAHGQPAAQAPRRQPAAAPVRYVSAVYILPKGYKSLIKPNNNPATRGVGTVQGQAAMDLLWTRSTPRQLIDATTGTNMTTRLVNIRWPYTTAAPRKYASAAPTYRSSYVRRSRVKTPDAASPLNMKKFRNIQDTSAALDVPAVQVAAVKSTRVAPAVTAGRYVQVATFGVASNATRTVARFRQAGLPTAARGLRRGGKAYQVVFLGPFKDRATLSAALFSARGAGFGDAFTTR